MTGQGRIDVAASKLHPVSRVDYQTIRNESNNTARTAVDVDKSSHIGHVIWIDGHARTPLCALKKMHGLVRREEADDLSTYRRLI